MKRNVFQAIASIFLAATVFVGCTKNDNNSSSATAQYQGNWSGTYSSSRSDSSNTKDNGTWTMTVAADGKTSGTITSSVIVGQTFVFVGTVNASGALNTVISTSASAAAFANSFLNGTLVMVNNTGSVSGNFGGIPVTGAASATWAGTFTGSKK
ncbi:hypothetical protein [Asinibacterium sp. OR53]|uniref:hypothetical protein n=1 Tax=Asinibacterium sp. OR53 TaxID=925409 RepID=UPI00047DAF26|nr:hypothetical protein [Asinibacterium sp. OR53]